MNTSHHKHCCRGTPVSLNFSYVKDCSTVPVRYVIFWGNRAKKVLKPTNVDVTGIQYIGNCHVQLIGMNLTWPTFVGFVIVAVSQFHAANRLNFKLVYTAVCCMYTLETRRRWEFSKRSVCKLKTTKNSVDLQCTPNEEAAHCCRQNPWQGGMRTALSLLFVKFIWLWCFWFGILTAKTVYNEE